MGGIGPVPCEGLLIEGTCTCHLVDGTEPCLSEGPCFLQQCFWGVSGLGVAFGSLSANGQGYVPILLEGCGTEAYWLLGGAWS